MTVRHYYRDATTTQFSATVVTQTTYEGHPAAILDETYFYPTSGGQPHDTGRIASAAITAAVIDVVASAPNEPVVHVLDKPLPEGIAVVGQVDWSRRFDHMQQHTGQHILSQAFIHAAGAQTVGFHLSDQTVTIDLDTPALTPEQLLETERLANEVVWQNLPIAVRMVARDEAERLALRKLPPRHNGAIRLIAIGDFDLTACGGTHVAATGQVGLIKLVKTERRGEQTRVEFCCGSRALGDYRRKHAIVTQLAANLTTGSDDIVSAVSRLQDEARHWRSRASAFQKELVAHQARDLIQATPLENGLRVVVLISDDLETDALRQLANALIEHPQSIALLALMGDRTHFIFGRSADAPGHMCDLLRASLPNLPGSKGGGSATLAQGSGPAATRSELVRLLEFARGQLQPQVKPIE